MTNLQAARDTALAAGLLFMRVTVGVMMAAGHGWPKLSAFGAKWSTFADPLGVGSGMSLTLAVGAEFFCSILVVLGLATRFAAVPLLITMLVAALIVHADDPWSKKEFALMYAIPYVTLMLTGAGRFSLDEVIRRARDRRQAPPAPPPGAL